MRVSKLLRRCMHCLEVSLDDPEHATPSMQPGSLRKWTIDSNRGCVDAKVLKLH